ncbi:MAG: HEPN domain-containing protein [Candidatus Caldarchaeum sp.]
MAGRRKEVETLRRRALEFLEEARQSLISGRHNISYFLSEQASQLYIKAALLETVGDYPRTHYIRTLLGELVKSTSSKKLEQFIRENRAALSSLEDAYTIARYSAKEYTKEDAEDALRLSEEIIKLVTEAVSG